MNQTLIEFVKESKRAGKTLAEVRTVLSDTGWQREQVDEVMQNFVDSEFPVAVPKPVAFTSPRFAALNFFHFLMMYISSYNAIAVLFTFLDYYLPDGVGQMRGFYYSSYQTIGTVLRDNLAALIVCAPLTVASHYAILKNMRRVKQRAPRMRLFFIYTALLVGALSLVSSAGCLVYYFLAGELGIRVLMKVTILAGSVAWLYGVYRVETRDSELSA